MATCDAQSKRGAIRARVTRIAPLAIVAASLLLSGCGGRLIGVMAPSGKVVQGTSQVRLMAATTREPSADKSILFSGERGTDLKVDAITVSIPPEANRTVGQVQWPTRLPANPLKEFATVKVVPLVSKKDDESWLKQNLPKSRRALVFVHGFNNRYEDAVYRFAQIVHDSGADVVPVVFTWPSRASIFDYNYDKESTNYSRDALEDLLRRINAEPSIGEITVMAHSMGTWLAVESLRQMAIRDGRTLPKIRNVILASPDLDVDVFSRQFRSLGDNPPHFTLFVSQDDRALSVSRRISGNVDRLGQVDANAEPYRTQFEKAGISVIDLTKLKSGDSLNHGKFAESPDVVKLIGQRLIAGQTITDSDVGLGEAVGAVALGVSTTVGNAASVAVSAPIAVFDPRTRRNYGEQVQRLGRSVGNTLGSVGDTAGAAGLKTDGSQPAAKCPPNQTDRQPDCRN